jgi:large subunit ribosomal protein L22
MEASATMNYARIAPRKVRVVLNTIRDLGVEEAMARLKFAGKDAAQLVYKLLASAAANAHHQFGLTDVSALYVKQAFADQGPMQRRFRPRAMGRASRIHKKTSHVTVVVAES